MNNLDELKNKFIIGEILTLTINGALGRNRIYKKDVDEKRKKELNKFFRKELVELGNKCCNSIDNNEHIKLIRYLKGKSSDSFNDILLNGELTFGTSQKLLNLYLKYLWTLGLIPAPTHCPLDSTIIKRLKRIKNIENRWTKINEKDYILYINKIEKIKGDKSIAEWELEEWERKSEN